MERSELAKIPNFTIDFESVVMDALLNRDDVPVIVMLNKALRDAMDQQKEREEIEKWRHQSIL